MILINFKIYKETFGNKAIELAKICKEVMEETKIQIVPVVSALDAYRIQKEVGVKVYLQNIDEFDEGAKTGFISPIQAKEMGIKGALINHSEHKLKPGTILKILKNVPADFETVVCLQTLGQTERWAKKIKPSFIAYEPSYLIGNKEKSVATEKAEIIKKIVEKFPKVPILAGAGIKDDNDVRISLKMGAKGVLLASSVIKATNSKEELTRLARSFSV